MISSIQTASRFAAARPGSVSPAACLELRGRLAERREATELLAVPDAGRLEPAFSGPQPEVAERPAGVHADETERPLEQTLDGVGRRRPRARRCTTSSATAVWSRSRWFSTASCTSSARARARLVWLTSRMPIAVQKIASSAATTDVTLNRWRNAWLRILDTRTGLCDHRLGSLVCRRDVHPVVLGDPGRLRSEERELDVHVLTKETVGRSEAGEQGAQVRIEGLDLCDLLRMAVGVSADVGGFRFAFEERDGIVVELVLALVDPLEQLLGHRTAAHPLIRAREQSRCERPHDECHREDDDVRGPEPAA